MLEEFWLFILSRDHELRIKTMVKFNEENPEGAVFQKAINEHYSYISNEGGRDRVIIDEGYGNDALLGIESLVKQVVSTNELAFYSVKLIVGTVEWKALSLGRYYSSLNEFSANYDILLEYGPHIGIFYEVLKKVVRSSFEFPANPSEKVEFGKAGAEIFNEIIEEIRSRSKSAIFKKKLQRIKQNLQRNKESAENYVNLLFEKHARILVLRIDLHFSLGKAGNLKRLKITQGYFERFLNNKRNNKVFEHLVGYIWKLEEGVSRGVHYHLILFMNGSKVEKDSYLCWQIGEYWKQVTNGEGSYYNVNATIPELEKKGIEIGIGMVDHYDAEKRNVLITRVIHYFFKKGQYLSAKSLKKMRIYGRGEIPRTSGAGRPRTRTS